ncbi:BrnT family toxin [Gleimia europaea]|uniref:BrnT family toxin n=1 Tax=Gleimia europaea TaxID=66228 RepID=UPI003D6F36C9
MYVFFEWDEHKAALNIVKHGVSFDAAAEAFSDPYARVTPDIKHSDDEERFFLIGMDLQARVLTVCHCERNGGEAIRIISARKSTKTESRQYWRYRHE